MLQKESKMRSGFELKGRVVFFATNNVHKFLEVRAVLASYGIAVGMLRVKGVEVQSDNLCEIAAASAVDAYKRCHLPLIVEDAGLFVDALKGFPGPYAAYVYKTLGNSGLLNLLENTTERSAKFKSAIVFCDSLSREPFLFEGEVAGEVTVEEHKANAKSSFGFDPVFQPCGGGKTFAEMSVEEKNRFSHRAAAVRLFAKWYKLG